MLELDGAGNVWIGGNAPPDRQVLKFSADGKLLLEIGHSSSAPKNNQDTGLLGQPAAVEVDDAALEVYIADGYMNKLSLDHQFLARPDAEIPADRRWGG